MSLNIVQCAANFNQEWKDCNLIYICIVLQVYLSFIFESELI